MPFYKNGNVGSDSFNELTKTNIVEADMETKTLDDGSLWAKIFSHNNHAGTVLFSSSDDFANKPVIKDADRYSRLYLMSALDNKGIYEFMALQPDVDSTIYRWTQTNNPLKSTTVGTLNVISGSNISGLVRCSGNTFLARSSSTGNWWCAIGCWTPYNGGIPGFNSKVVTTTLELWIRIDNISDTFNIFNKYIMSQEFIEI